MGVPKLFQIILDRFPNSHQQVGSQPVSHFFIDFNCLIYEAREKVIRAPGTTAKNAEQRILAQVIKTLQQMISMVNPSKMVYFAFDGPPPRGKMILQRQRRYRKLLEEFLMEQIQIQYGTPEKNLWNAAQITPGTAFMARMSQTVERAIKTVFPKNLTYVLSDASVPGEGEHKFLPYLDTLKSTTVAIYSNDGDLLMLANRVPHHRVFILTKPKETSKISQQHYKSVPYFYVDIQGFGDGFMIEAMGLSQTPRKQIERTNKEMEALPIKLPKFPPPYEKDRILYDYLFYSMLGGNDFVRQIIFLQLKEHDTLNTLVRIYRKNLPDFGYLVIRNKKKIQINHDLFVQMMAEIAELEPQYLRRIERKIRMTKSGKKKKKSGSLNPNAEQWEKDWDHFQHTYYFKEEHPQFELYRDLFRKINYFAPDFVWKQQYYRHFFHFNYKENKDKLNFICQQYLTSLVWTLQYYLIGPPSWRWYYPFRASPLPSDLLAYLETHLPNINSLNKFQNDRSFRPLEQLLLVLPPQTDLLPPDLLKITTKYPQMYPVDFQLDILWGLKFIYSEPILPLLKVPVILGEMSKVKLTPQWKKLNQLNSQPKTFPSATSKKK